MSLVIALPLGIWLTKQHIGPREWLGALAVLVGIMFFLWAGAPSGGTNNPSASLWWGACLGTAVLVGALAALGTRMKGASKALLFGCAAGFGYGLQAAVTKTFVGELGHGALSLLADWSVYVLVASAVIGFVLQQGALKTGVLAPAMASSNAVTLFSSVILGIVVYGERLSAGGGGHAASAAVGLVVAIVGIVLLGSAEGPPDNDLCDCRWHTVSPSDDVTWWPHALTRRPDYPARAKPSTRWGDDIRGLHRFEPLTTLSA